MKHQADRQSGKAMSIPIQNQCSHIPTQRACHCMADNTLSVWKSVHGKDSGSFTYDGLSSSAQVLLSSISGWSTDAPSQDGTKMKEKLSRTVVTVGLYSQMHTFLRITERLLHTCAEWAITN